MSSSVDRPTMIDVNESAYHDLQGHFQGDSVLPSPQQYATAIRPWSSLAERPAGLVAFPKTENDVSAVIQYAVKEGLEVAVKGKSPQALMLVACHLGPAEAAKEKFKMFYDPGSSKRCLHGPAYYMAGATVRQPTFDVAKRVSAMQASLIQELPQVRPMIGFELFSLGQVNAVSNDAMAFCCRGTHINVVLNLSWGHEGEGDKTVDLERVRSKARDIVKAIQVDVSNPDAAYDNYEGDRVVGDHRVRLLFGTSYAKLQKI